MSVSNNIQIIKNSEINCVGSLRKECLHGQRVRNYHGDCFVNSILEKFNNYDYFENQNFEEKLSNLSCKEKKLLLDTFKGKTVSVVDLFKLKNKLESEGNSDETFQSTGVIEKTLKAFQRFICFGTQSDEKIKFSLKNAAEEFKQRRSSLSNSDQFGSKALGFHEVGTLPTTGGGIEISIAPHTNILEYPADFKVAAGSPTLHSSSNHSSPGGLAGAFNEALKKTENKKGWKAFQQAIREFVHNNIESSTTEFIPQKQSWLQRQIDAEITPQLNSDKTLVHLSHLDESKPDQKLIWVNGPRYPESDKWDLKKMGIDELTESEALKEINGQLKDCYKAVFETVLREAKESNKAEVTVAIPLISAGIFKCPPHLSIYLAYKAYDEFIQETSGEEAGHIKMNVVICAKDKDESQILESCNKDYWENKKPKDSSELCDKLKNYTREEVSQDELNYLQKQGLLDLPFDFDNALEELTRFRTDPQSQQNLSRSQPLPFHSPSYNPEEQVEKWTRQTEENRNANLTHPSWQNPSQSSYFDDPITRKKAEEWVRQSDEARKNTIPSFRPRLPISSHYVDPKTEAEVDAYMSPNYKPLESLNSRSTKTPTTTQSNNPFANDSNDYNPFNNDVYGPRDKEKVINPASSGWPSSLFIEE